MRAAHLERDAHFARQESESALARGCSTPTLSMHNAGKSETSMLAAFSLPSVAASTTTWGDDASASDQGERNHGKLALSSEVHL